ncbi:phytochelatin synthase family protein [Defluviimonas sp. WL0002]|uniref:glutathione gamma-glutamylcysteinyltransferase n=1 Tax=Albidovulum marisflavi TaxID=2984159 RepID=A0ABT2ZBJ7_9RHOB|nr:phytochelatin synthase family protein [Defluviimonas sp. WL0002]MCV2868461.1 phytochelatin synthase family protein [Defluviimonas sp. WL0002]
MLRKLSCLLLLGFAAPAIAETLPLPDGLIALNSVDGQALLIGSEARSDYFELSIHFTNQVHPAFCGPASMSMVLNALNVPRPASNMTLGLGMFDQDNVFTPATEAVKPRALIERAGLTLDELGAMFEAHSLKATVRHAEESSVEEFRTLARESIDDAESFVLVNYLRSSIGQERGGHISPLGAYDAETDRFLILDVTRYKYPPVWVRTDDLFQAMNTPDSDNDNRSRGYLLVRQ